MYERQKRLDTDPDAPTLPPEMWQNAVVGKSYRPLKTAVSVRIDNDVLAWLKAQGDGHLTRINDILRHAMLAQPKAKHTKGPHNYQRGHMHLSSGQLLNYSVITRSAHSTSETKIAGLPTFAPHWSRSVCSTARARLQAPQA